MKTRIPRSQVVKSSWFGALAGIGAVAALALGSSAYAGEPAPAVQDVQEEIQRLKDLAAREAEEMERQARQLEEQARALEAQRRRLENLEAQFSRASEPLVQPAVYPVRPWLGGHPSDVPRFVQTPPAANQEPAPVGEPEPKKKSAPEVSGVYEAGGVLTRKGTIIVQPTIRYSQSNINRFFFQGIEIVETILVGQIQATDSDRDTLVVEGTLRYGLTDRAEVEVKVPFIHRDDRINRLIVSTQTESTRELDGDGIGDVEAAARYQINSGRAGWPIFVANARVKSDTGDGPFDISRDANGIETELPTGSGFWAVQGGLTTLFPSDPAVLFATATYTAHLERDVDTAVGSSTIGTVDPGDIVAISFGMGFGINEQASFSIGYEHNFIEETTTEIDGADVKGQTLDVGSLLLGFSYVFSDWIALNLNVEAGITEDAPDVQLILRVPMKFDLF